MRLPHPQVGARGARRGVALVLFVVLVFVFFAIAGIAIDVGMASLTQQEMQVAVDPAALEGMRLRDFNLYQFSSDQGRRPRVSNLVRQVFDDDLHPTGGIPAYGMVPAVPPDDADALQLGAGPFFRVTGQGTSPLAEGGVIGIPATPTWDDPILQENKLPSGEVGNFANGDMVSGTFNANATHEESSDYIRSDFRPAPPPNGPALLQAEKWEALGFLVRMRRTPGTNFMDSQPGKASHGPTVPFLWALGSLMRKADGESWDPRRDGMTVRATAIAVGRPALRVSPAPINPATGLPIVGESDNPSAMLGLHSLALSLEYWTSLVPGGPFVSNINDLTIGTGGTLQVGGQVVGYIVRSNTMTSIGRAVTPDAGAPLPASLSPGYAAVYSAIPANTTGPERVVGYVFLDASRNTSTSVVRIRPGIIAPASGSTTSVRLWVGANGVSAQIGFDTPALSKVDWDEIFRLNRILAFGGVNNLPNHEVNYDYARIRPGTLLAPALAR